MRATMLILSVAAFSLQSSAQYQITHTYNLGGDGGWDYIVPDSPNHRLFIGRQDRVMVVDENTGAVVGNVTGIKGAHGTAIAGSTGHGFATSGQDASVVMFDLTSFKALGRIAAAEDADAIIYDDASKRVFTFNGDAHSSTVIDPREGTLVTILRVPAFIATLTILFIGRGIVNVLAAVFALGGLLFAGRDRCEDRHCLSAVADGAMQAAGRHGHRHRASPVVQRLPERCHGRLGLPGWQDRRDRAHRDRRGRGGVRHRIEQCVRFECRRHADGHSPGLSRQVQRRPDTADGSGIAQHGTRPDESSHLHRLGQVRSRARDRSRTRTDGAWVVQPDGYRTRRGEMSLRLGGIPRRPRPSRRSPKRRSCGTRRSWALRSGGRR